MRIFNGLGVCVMQSAETVVDILRARGRRGLPCDELYRQLFNPALFLMAWGRIYANDGAMISCMGTEATLYIDRGRYEIRPEWNRKGAAEEMILGTNPTRRGADFYDKPDGELLHLSNWVECVKSRKRPHCPAEAGVSAASAAHLANLALRSGQVVTWKAN